MISFLEGTIEHSTDKSVVLCAGGIGYKVTVSPKVLTIVAKNKGPVKLHIHSQLNMREGTFDMYGFNKHEDLELFHLLTTVSGIGPKGAMGIMASVEPSHLKAAVVNDDPDYLKKVSGISPKLAQRLVLELKNKVDYLESTLTSSELSQETQATEALMSLGYSLNQAKDVLKNVKGDTLQEVVTQALKMLGKK